MKCHRCGLGGFQNGHHLWWHLDICLLDQDVEKSTSIVQGVDNAGNRITPRVSYHSYAKVPDLLAHPLQSDNPFNMEEDIHTSLKMNLIFISPMTMRTTKKESLTLEMFSILLQRLQECQVKVVHL